MVRGYAAAGSGVLDLGWGRGGVVEPIWRDVKLAAGLDPDAPSLTGHRAPGMPILRGVGEHLPFGGGLFELGVSVWVRGHLREPLPGFRGAGLGLRAGGHFVFLMPELAHPRLA